VRRRLAFNFNEERHLPPGLIDLNKNGRRMYEDPKMQVEDRITDLLTK
jgi:hypothetical protein